MLGVNLFIKLSGIHKVAFHGFCERMGITKSKYGILKIIEMLPEYQRLTDLPVNNNSNKETLQSQDNSSLS